MNLRIPAALSLSFALPLVAACDNGSTSTSGGADTSKPAATSAPGSTATAADGPLPVTGDKECDEAAAKWKACADKNPAVKAKAEEVRAKLEAFKGDMANPQTKGMVGGLCKMFFEMKMMDCK